MTGRDKFTPEEWELLTKAGVLMGHSIIISDKPRRARKEQRIMRKALETTAANYPGNELIATIMPEAKVEAKVRIDAKTLFQQRDIITEGFMNELSKVGKILAKAEEKEAREFKLWVLNIGEVTALAVRDEELANLGLPGEEISKTEKRILKRAAKEMMLVPYTVDMNPVHTKKSSPFRKESKAPQKPPT